MADPLAGLDEYELRHLAEHLVEGGVAKVHDLLWLEAIDDSRDSESGSPPANAWYAAKERHGTTDEYVDDVRHAWRFADRSADAEIASAVPADSVGLGIRYALLTTSVNSAARNVPAPLLGALVAAGIWNVRQAAATARQIAHPLLRAEGLAAVAPFLEEPDRTIALSDALEAARDIRASDDWRARALKRVAPFVTPALLDQALSVARLAERSARLAEGLAALLPALPVEPRAAVAREALAALDRPEDPNLPLEPGDPQAFTPPSELVAEVWARIASFDSGPVRDELASAALRVARDTMESFGLRADTWQAIADHIPDGAVADWLADVCEVGADRDRAEGLAGLAHRLSDDDRRTALVAARRIDDPAWRSHALTALSLEAASRTRDADVLDEALAAAREPEIEPGRRARLLTAIASAAEASTRRNALLREALAAVSREGGTHLPQLRAALARLSGSEDALRAVLAEAAAEGEDWGSERFKTVLEDLPDSLREEAIAAYRQFPDDDAGWLAPSVLPLLSDEARQREVERILVWATAVGEEERTLRAPSVAVEIAGWLPAPVREAALERALAIAKGLGSEAWEDAGAVLVPALAEVSPTRALAWARSLPPSRRLDALVAIAQRMPGPERAPALDAVVSTAREIRAEWALSDELLELVPDADRDALIREALEWPSRSEYGWMSLVPYRSEAVIRREVARVRATFDDPYQRDRYLAYLVVHLLPAAALAEAKSIEHPVWRAEALTELASTGPDDIRAEVVDAAVETARAITEASVGADNAASRAEALLSVLRFVEGSLRTELLREAVVAARAARSRYPREALLRDLTPELSRQPRDALHALWRDTLPVLAARTRDELTAELAALAPLVRVLGGQAAVAGAWDATEKVRAWWP